MGESDALGLIRRASNSLPTSKFPISLSSPRTTGWNKLTNSQYLQALDHVNIPIYKERICQHITRKKKKISILIMKHSNRPQDFDLQKAEQERESKIWEQRSLQHPDHINNSYGISVLALPVSFTVQLVYDFHSSL